MTWILSQSWSPTAATMRMPGTPCCHPLTRSTAATAAGVLLKPPQLQPPSLQPAALLSRWILSSLPALQAAYAPAPPHLLLAPRCCAPHHHSWSTMQMIAVPSSSIHQPLPLYTLSFLNWLQPVVVSTQPLAQPYRWAALPPRTRGHHGTTVPLPSGHYHPYPLGAPAHTRSMTLLSGLFHSLSRGQASTSWRRQS